MKKNLTTQAGQADNDAPKGAETEEVANAINQVFAIFRRNYHNQYFKAFATEQDASVAKRLWFESLSRFSPDIILKGSKALIETSEFLPTLATMIKHCEKQMHRDLPDAHSAYIEACNAPSPKTEHEWSHPAIYHAGKQSDWFFIQNSSESIAFPVFKKVYEEICQKIMQGVKYDTPEKLALPDSIDRPLDKKTNLDNLNSLKERLDF